MHVILVFFSQAFEYKKLLMDYNREVRRATHDTMTNIVTAVGFVLGLFDLEWSNLMMSMLVGI